MYLTITDSDCHSIQAVLMIISVCYILKQCQPSDPWFSQVIPRIYSFGIILDRWHAPHFRFHCRNPQSFLPIISAWIALEETFKFPPTSPLSIRFCKSLVYQIVVLQFTILYLFGLIIRWGSIIVMGTLLLFMPLFVPLYITRFFCTFIHYPIFLVHFPLKSLYSTCNVLHIYSLNILYCHIP